MRKQSDFTTSRYIDGFQVANRKPMAIKNRRVAVTGYGVAAFLVAVLLVVLSVAYVARLA